MEVLKAIVICSALCVILCTHIRLRKRLNQLEWDIDKEYNNEIKQLMIQEDYCSDELSKLLKEKGFDWDCDHYYKPNGEIVQTFHTEGSHHINSSVLYEHQCLAPTHQMAMKWLREECKVFIGVKYNPYYKQFKVQITLMDYSKEAIIKGIETEINNLDNMFFDTFKEAVEAAMKYSLVNLI